MTIACKMDYIKTKTHPEIWGTYSLYHALAIINAVYITDITVVVKLKIEARVGVLNTFLTSVQILTVLSTLHLFTWMIYDVLCLYVIFNRIQIDNRTHLQVYIKVSYAVPQDFNYVKYT